MNKKIMTLGLVMAAVAFTACGNKAQTKQTGAGNSAQDSATATALRGVIFSFSKRQPATTAIMGQR